MKTFGRALILFMVTVALLPLFYTPSAHAMTQARNGKYGVLNSNAFLETMTAEERKEAAEKSGGLIPTTPREYVVHRLGLFAETFDCNIFLNLFTDMEDANFDGTFEELVDYLSTIGDTETNPAFTAEDAVFVVYVQDLDQSYIRIGKNVVESCELSAVEAVLHDVDEVDPYFKTTKIIEALAQALRDGGAGERYLLQCTPYAAREQLESALAPLREHFSGYVRLIYLDSAETTENMTAEMSNQYKLFAYSMADSIYIAYYRNTGEAVVRVGDRTGLTVKDLSAVEAAFQPGADSKDFSGFTTGVYALSDALGHNSGVSPALIGALIGGTAVVAVLVAGAVVLFRRQKQ